MRRIVIKEGPLVFLRNVIIMEIVASIFFYGLLLLRNYPILYEYPTLTELIRDHVLIVVIFSIFQCIYILFLFFEWYFSHFEITEKELVKKWGLLFRRHRSIGLADVVSVETYQSPLSRMMRLSTIILNHENGRVTKIRNVLNADEYAYLIQQMTGKMSSKSARGITHFITEGEGRFVEFKQTLRYDVRAGEVSKEMERMVLKSIVAFLNTRGGTLLIGVSDAGETVGLDEDFKTLPKKNRDGFENHLSQLVKTHIGMPFTKYVSVSFEKVNGAEVCVVSVGESHKPAYLQNGNQKEDFFVRVGNSTQPFSMSETEEYIRTKWK